MHSSPSDDFSFNCVQVIPRMYVSALLCRHLTYHMSPTQIYRANVLGLCGAKSRTKTENTERRAVPCPTKLYWLQRREYGTFWGTPIKIREHQPTEQSFGHLRQWGLDMVGGQGSVQQGAWCYSTQQNEIRPQESSIDARYQCPLPHVSIALLVRCQQPYWICGLLEDHQYGSDLNWS